MKFNVLVKQVLIILSIVASSTLYVHRNNLLKDATLFRELHSETIEMEKTFYKNGNESYEFETLANTEEIQYYDSLTKSLKMHEATVIEGNEVELSSGWYVLNSSVVINSRIKIIGEVNIILADGSLLNASQGIEVVDGNKLTIWGQSADYENNGQIIARGPGDSAGIGGNKGQNSGVITINGGNIQATGGDNDGAGIGGGDHGKGTVFINGGYVYASGGMLGSGIGGGLAGNGEVTITGGIIEAYGGYASATGIGGGCDGSGDIVITGGNITAVGSDFASGIGGGQNGYGNVQITGGEVWSSGGWHNDYDIGDGTNSNHTALPKEGTFSTGDSGKAIVHGSISDESKKDEWKGIVDNTVYGDFEIDHDVNFDGTLTVPDGSSLTVKEGATLTTSDGIENHGKIENKGTIENTSDFVNDGEIVNDGVIENYGSLENTSKGVIENNNDFDNFGDLTNDGNFVNDGNLHNAGIVDNKNNFTNNGFVENDNTIFNSGDLTNEGSVKNNDNFYNTNEGSITNNKTFTNDGNLTNDGEVSNNGTLNNTSDGVIENNNNFTNSGKLTNDGEIANSGEVTNTSDGVITNNETFTNEGNMTNDGNVNNKGNFNNTNEGSITNNETFTNDGNLTNDGEVSNNGTLNNTSEGNITNNETFTNSGKLTNDGSISNNEGSSFENQKNGLVQNNKDFVNKPGANYQDNGTTQNKKFVVKFVFSNDKQIPDMYLEAGSKIKYPNYTKEGYTLIGWYLDENFTDEWDFDNDVMPSNDITLYAKLVINSYTLSFSSNENTELPEDITKNYGTKVVLPKMPSKKGYTGKWMIAGKEVTEVTITGNITVDFVYVANSYTVTFISNNEVIAKTNAKFDEKLSEPRLSSRSGYQFDGWYRNKDFSDKWNFNEDVIDSSITLYAKWIKKNGILSEDVTLSDKTSGVKLDMEQGELANAVVDDEDRELLKEGKSIQIILDIDDDNISEKDKETLKEKVVDYTLYKYFDIEVLKIIDNNKETISKTLKPIRITIDIPTEIKGREYAVIRLHDGKVTFLDDLDYDDKTYTFESDEFSIYALAYKDEVISNDEEVKKHNIDWIKIVLILIILIIICIIITIIIRKKDNEITK